MNGIFASAYFGIGLSVIAFGIGVKLNQKFKTPFCNPLIIAIVLVSAVLLIFKIPYEDYNKGGEIINMFLAPATACLAVAVYTKLQILKQYWLPILAGCAAGSAASMGSVYLLCRLFGLEESLTVSLLPKSVTTPIAVSIAEPAGGMVPITVVAVIFTGILGGIFAPLLIRLFRVSDPVAAGLAIGASSHAVGTSKAIELGEIEGAMSGLAIGICWISILVEKILPFAFPASVIGMLLLFICLLTGLLKIEHIQEKADFLLENMAFFFVPAGVSIINYFDVLKSTWIQLVVICVISTVVTFAVTAWSVKLTVRLLSRLRERRSEK